jgi:hypothetical protein
VIITLVMVAAIVAAVASMGLRRRRRSRLRAAARTRAGATPDLAIAIRSFGEMEEHIDRRWCHCGGYLERSGEGTREVAGRRFRVARLTCHECESVDEVFFDTTGVLH